MPRLRVYLLKEAVTDFEGALRIDESGSHPLMAPLKAAAGVDGVVYYRRPYRKQPDWLEYLSSGLKDTLDFSVATASALLLLRVEGRIFALTFGFGGTMLAPNARVRDFGVRVALNSVDPTLIKSVDMRRIEEMTVHTRRQVSRASNLTPFRIDQRQDFIRSLGGRPYESLGWKGMLEGADSIAVTCDVAFDGLPTLCIQLLALYESSAYVDRGFGFFDNLRIVTDPDDLDRLNSALDDALASGDTGGIHMSLPDAMDLGDINSYKYRGRGQAHAEIDIDDMLDELRAAGVDVTVDWLSRHDLLVNYARSPEADYSRCPLIETIVFETPLDSDSVFVLSAGEWHRVGLELITEVEQRLSAVSQCSDAFPACVMGWTEERYNREASMFLGHACMDEKCVVIGGGDKVEFCDLLGLGGRLVHVKKRSRSSTLSHLFLQGLNSARLFLESPEFRDSARAKVEAVSPAHAALIPAAPPDPSHWEVVYGIIGKPGTQQPNALPFFSRLSMAEATAILSGMGYRVAYAPIEYAVP